MSELDCGYPSAVEDWNAQYPPGTPVMYWTGFREQEGQVGLTRSEARLMGDDPVVWVTGHGACIALTHVSPIKDQRRALLAHLLAAEGLPGVEEIAKYQAAVAKIPEIVAKALRQIDDKEDEIEWLRQQLVDALAEKRRRELAQEITQPVDPVSMPQSEVSDHG